MHHDTFTVSKSHSILIYFVDYKTRLPVKIPKITVLSNISFATILTNIFTKQKFILFVLILSEFRQKKKNKASEWYYRRRKCTGTKTIRTVHDS